MKPNFIINQIYCELLDSKSINKVTAILCIFLSWFPLYISILEIYQKLLIIRNQNDQVANYIYTFLQYFNIHYYVDNCQFIGIYVLIGIIILLIYIACILSVYLITKISNKKYRIFNKFICFISDIIIYVLLYPLLILFFTGIQCIQLNNNYQLIIKILIFIFSGLSILLLGIISVIHSLIFYNCWKEKNDFLTRNSSQSAIIQNIIKVICACFIAFQQENEKYYIIELYIHMIISLCLNLFELISLENKQFQKYIICFIQKICLLFYLTLSINIILTNYIKYQPLIIIIIIYGLIILTQIKILRYLKIRKFFQEPKSIEDLQNKISIFIEMQQQISQINYIGELLYLGTIYNHLAHKCKNQTKEFGQRCFCTYRIIYDSKKQKDIRITIDSIKHNTSIFSKFLIKSWYEKQLQQNNRNPILRFYYTTFLFFKLNNKLQALQQLKQIEIFQSNIILQMRLFQLRYILQFEINNQNSLAYQSFLDFEYVIQMEQTIYQIFMTILKIINLNITFWKRLNQLQINEDILLKINTEITQQIKISKNLWISMQYQNVKIKQKDVIISFISRKQKWKFIYYWYKLYILNKKIRLSSIEHISSSLIIQDIVNEDSDSDTEIKPFEQFHQYKPFNHLSLIIQSLMNGEIINYSKSCDEVLEYQNLKSIYQIIPQILQRNHQQAIKQLLYNGKSTNMYKIKSIFLKHSNGYIIQAKKYLKWIWDNQLQQITFIAMLRPIIRLEQINFIIVNSEWEVDSVTRPLQKILPNQTCLLLLCNKLFKYSDYGQYLKHDDFENLKITNPSTLNIQSQSDTLGNISLNNNNQSKLSQNDKFYSDLEIYSQNIFLDDEKTIINNTSKKFVKIIDEKHVQLILRIPKKLKELNEEYIKMKKELYFEIIQYNNDTSSSYFYTKKKSIVYRNKEGQLRFNKLVLFRKLLDFKLRFLKELFEVKKILYQKYCSNNIFLDKIIKLDASIKFTKYAKMQKVSIIKINKYEILEYKKKQFEESPNLLTEHKIKSRPSIAELYLDTNFLRNQRNSQANSQANNSEVDSNRIDQNKSFLTEGQVFPEFIQFQPNEVILNIDNSIFLKQDNNTITKQIKEISLITFFSRIIFILFYLIIIFDFVNQQKLSQQNDMSKAQLLLKQIISIIQVYEYTLDSYISNSNSWNVQQDEIENYMIKKKNIINSSYIFLNNSFSDASFIEIQFGLNENLYSIIDQLGLFRFYLQQLNQYIFSEIENQYNILSNLRQLIFVNNDSIIYDLLNSYRFVITDYYSDIQEYFNIKILIISLSGSIIILIIIVNIILIIQLFKKNQTSLQLLRLIQKKYILESLQHYYYLKAQFQFLIEFDTIKSLKTNNQTNQLNEEISNLENEEEQNLKHNNGSYLISKSWNKYMIQYSLCYLFICLIVFFLSLYYHFFSITNIQDVTNLFENNQFKNNFTYLIGLISAKEVYLQTQQNQTNIDITNYYKNLIIFQEQQTDTNIYNTNIDILNILFYGNVCELWNDDECNYLMNGALQRGLNQYNILLGQLIYSLTYPNETIYDEPSYPQIFQFSKLQLYVYQIIYNAYMTWQSDLSDLINHQTQIDLIIFVVTMFCTLLFHYIFIEIIFTRSLSKKYKLSLQFIKRFYSNNIINFQKNIRAKFVKYEIIKK